MNCRLFLFGLILTRLGMGQLIELEPLIRKEGSTSPAVTSQKDGKWLVVWVIQFTDILPNPHREVYGRVHDRNMNPIGDRFRVNTHTVANQMNPDCVDLPNGDFVVVWDSLNQDGSAEGVYFQRVNPAGQLIGSEQRVNLMTEGSQRSPKVAANQSNIVLVAWEDESLSGDFSIQGQYFRSDGLRLGVQFEIAGSSTVERGSIAVASLPDQRFLVTWNEKIGATGSSANSYVKILKYLGQSSNIEPMGNTTRFGFSSGVASLPNNQFLFSWGNSFGIYSSIVNADLESRPIEPTNTNESRWDNTPVASSDLKGDINLAYLNPRYPGEDAVFLQRIDSQGNLIRQAKELARGSHLNLRDLAIGTDRHGNSLIVWANHGPIFWHLDAYFETPLDPPINVIANTFGSNAIDVSWELRDRDEQQYHLERKVHGESFWIPLVTVARDVSSYRDSGLLPDTHYSYRVISVGGGDTSRPSDPISARTPVSIHAWLGIHFPGDPAPFNILLERDDDSDGYPNFLEYALGMNPHSGEIEWTPNSHAIIQNGGEYPVFSFRRVSNREGISYAVEMREPDGTWVQGASQIGSPVPQGDGTEIVSFQSPFTLSERASQFLRLRVTLE